MSSNILYDEIPWYAFKKLATISPLPLHEQTRKYQEYMLQVFEARRQCFLMEQMQQQTTTANSGNSGGASGTSPSSSIDNALLLENSSYLLQENESNILLE
jgi:hypothetical protein